MHIDDKYLFFFDFQVFKDVFERVFIFLRFLDSHCVTVHNIRHDEGIALNIECNSPVAFRFVFFCVYAAAID